MRANFNYAQTGQSTLQSSLRYIDQPAASISSAGMSKLAATFETSSLSSSASIRRSTCWAVDPVTCTELVGRIVTSDERGSMLAALIASRTVLKSSGEVTTSQVSSSPATSSAPASSASS